MFNVYVLYVRVFSTEYSTDVLQCTHSTLLLLYLTNIQCHSGIRRNEREELFRRFRRPASITELRGGGIARLIRIVNCLQLIILRATKFGMRIIHIFMYVR